MLKHDNGALFVNSRTQYLDNMGERPENRIYIPVKFDTLPKTFAIVDTGAPWCILSEEQVEVLNENYKNEALETITMQIRGEMTEGVLIRLPITIIAEQGEDITIDGTIFVPQDERELPDFIGLDGFLNRIKFAIDPYTHDFYFGPIT